MMYNKKLREFLFWMLAFSIFLGATFLNVAMAQEPEKIREEVGKVELENDKPGAKEDEMKKLKKANKEMRRKRRRAMGLSLLPPLLGILVLLFTP